MFNLKILSDFNIMYSQNSRGFAEIDCPLCGGHGSRNGGIHVRKSYYICFRCGSSRLDYVLSLLLHMPIPDIARLLKDYQSSDLGYIYEGKEIRHSLLTKVTMPGEELKPVHRDYLEERGYNPDILIREYGLRGTTYKNPGWEWRIMIPMYHNGQLVSYQGRSIRADDKLRYRGASVEESIIHYKNLLYGEDKVESDQVGIVEGLFDMYRMNCDVTCWLCSFGSTFSPQQLRRLLRYKKVFLFLDPSDREAQEKAKKYTRQLRGFGVDAERIWDDQGFKDPDSMDLISVRRINRELGFVKSK